MPVRVAAQSRGDIVSEKGSAAVVSPPLTEASFKHGLIKPQKAAEAPMANVGSVRSVGLIDHTGSLGSARQSDLVSLFMGKESVMRTSCSWHFVISL